MEINYLIASLVIILIIVSPGSSEDSEPSSPSDSIDHFILALPWPTNFCLTTRCTRPPDVVLPNYFTVHGLWPQKAFPPGAHRLPGHSSLIECSPTPQFDPNAIAPRYNILKHFWPDDLTTMDPTTYFSFWKYKWDKHGTCTEPMFNQTQYFTITADIINGLDIVGMLRNAGISPEDRRLTASRVRAAFSGMDHIKEPFIRCDWRGRFILELYFCPNRDASQFVDCKTFYDIDNDCNSRFGF